MGPGMGSGMGPGIGPGMGPGIGPGPELDNKYLICDVSSQTGRKNHNFSRFKQYNFLHQYICYVILCPWSPGTGISENLNLSLVECDVEAVEI